MDMEQRNVFYMNMNIFVYYITGAKKFYIGRLSSFSITIFSFYLDDVISLLFKGF